MLKLLIVVLLGALSGPGVGVGLAQVQDDPTNLTRSFGAESRADLDARAAAFAAADAAGRGRTRVFARIAAGMSTYGPCQVSVATTTTGSGNLVVRGNVLPEDSHVCNGIQTWVVPGRDGQWDIESLALGLDALIRGPGVFSDNDGDWPWGAILFRGVGDYMNFSYSVIYPARYDRDARDYVPYLVRYRDGQEYVQGRFTVDTFGFDAPE